MIPTSSRPSFQSTSKLRTRRARLREFMSAWLVVSAIVISILGLLWVARQQNWTPESFQSLLLMKIGKDEVFVPGEQLSLQAARTLYHDSLSAKQKKDHEVALAGFQRLEKVYPGLLSFILLHEADIYAELGQELNVQKALKRVVENRKTSGQALIPVAMYRLGQSHYRAGEPELARQQFDALSQKHPDTNYATGSLYYLAQLALQQEDTAKASQLALQYLQACPDCRFSTDLALIAESTLSAPTAEEHALIGQGLLQGNRIEQAIAHMKQGPAETTWLPLARAYDQAKNRDDAGKTLLRGLPHAKNYEQVQAGIDLLLRLLPENEHAFALRELKTANLPHAADYILWRLAQADSSNRTQHLNALVQEYPKSDYAPESSWQLLWNQLKAGQAQNYVSQARAFLERYHYARSAPKVLFWLGKTLEKSRPDEARDAYERLVRQYPGNYYTFRAESRLKALSGQPDPGWRTSDDRNYPLEQEDWNNLKILPAPEHWSNDPRNGEILYRVAEELRAIGAADDLALHTQETLGELPPSVESWVAHVKGDAFRGIKVIRDAVERRGRPGINDKDYGLIPDEAYLLYPLYYPEAIHRFAGKNRLDPWVVQALMREESHFNPQAVSVSNALGLMQLLPTTAAEVAKWERLGFKTDDLFVPEVNIQLGSRYLAYLHERFSGSSMPSVGAYNGGPNAMARWVSASPYFRSDPDRFIESIPYEQTREYIKKVFGSYWNYRRLYSSAAR